MVKRIYWAYAQAHRRRTTFAGPKIPEHVRGGKIAARKPIF